MRLLVTGGAGFIGSNFILYWLNKFKKDYIVNLDALTYAGNLNNLKSIENSGNYKFVKGDIGDYKAIKKLIIDEKIEIIVNFTAESHVGRALFDPEIFVKTNILGVQMLIEAARQAKVKRFHQISSCEVYGDMDFDDKGAFKETDPYVPKTPYNATKAGINLLIMSYFHTFGFPATISHCTNNYGPYQFPEKIIPRFITQALENNELTLFKSSNNKREWLHVLDHCRAIDLIIHKSEAGEIYNVGSGVEKSIEEIADIILEKLNKPKSLKTYIEDRPGHNKRYLVDCAKIKSKLGWEAKYDFNQGIKETIKWYQENKNWWQPLIGKGFEENYKKVKK